MKSAKLRLVLAAAAFAAWIAFLFYLAFTTRNPVVLARPQFLAATLDAIVEIDNPSALQVKVLEVHWPEKERELVGQTISIANLAECDGWKGPGSYIVPLVRQGKDTYLVAATPRSPGFDPRSTGYKPRIYPATPEARRQLEEIYRPEK